MSTKTTFKRIALVTVAALGLSIVAVAPSSAAVQADTLAISSATGSTTVGTAVTVTTTVSFIQETSSDSMTVGLTYDAAPAGIAINEVTFTNTATANATDLGTPVVETTTPNSRLAKISTTAAASVRKTMTVTLTPSKAGTYVIRFTPAILPSGTPVSVAKTWTVTVAAKTIGSNSAFINTNASATSTADAAAATLNAFTSAANATTKARIDVAQMYGATGNDTATAADGKEVVVSISKGLVSKTDDYTAASASVTTLAGTAGAGGNAAYSYYVFSNGSVGSATISISVGGVALTAKTVAFTSVATTLVATLTAGQATRVGVAGNSTVTITSTDAGGSAVSNPAGLTVASSDTTVATVAITSGVVTITGVKAGTAKITVTDPATSAAATAATYSVTVAPVKPTAVDVTFDKTSYEVGELVTLTVSANMGDSATAQLFSSAGLVLSASVVPSGTAIPSGTSHAIVDGKATYKFYAPAVSGTLIATGTTGGAVDVTTAVVITKPVSLTNASTDAATAAAEEATAAANDATDAALSAAEAAEAATAMAQEAVDAVAELSASVTKLISALRAQITTLTNLVVKIQKKVKA